jgi:hypothetical protein
MKNSYVAQTGLELLNSSDPPASASAVFGNTGVHVCLVSSLFKHEIRDNFKCRNESQYLKLTLKMDLRYLGEILKRKIKGFSKIQNSESKIKDPL